MEVGIQEAGGAAAAGKGTGRHEPLRENREVAAMKEGSRIA
ncbi:MAG: hypothetical protein ABEJ36_06380 [Candidatus Nanosalina sp.]